MIELPERQVGDEAPAPAETAQTPGRSGRARRPEGKIAGFSTGILYYGNIYARSLYMLGRMYEERGWNEKARDSFQKFLDLWKDADPDRPEVTDARKRLASLTH
jgi:hypothetical protein